MNFKQLKLMKQHLKPLTPFNDIDERESHYLLGLKERLPAFIFKSQQTYPKLSQELTELYTNLKIKTVQKKNKQFQLNTEGNRIKTKGNIIKESPYQMWVQKQGRINEKNKSFYHTKTNFVPRVDSFERQKSLQMAQIKKLQQPDYFTYTTSDLNKAKFQSSFMETTLKLNQSSNQERNFQEKFTQNNDLIKIDIKKKLQHHKNSRSEQVTSVVDIEGSMPSRFKYQMNSQIAFLHRRNNSMQTQSKSPVPFNTKKTQFTSISFQIEKEKSEPGMTFQKPRKSCDQTDSPYQQMQKTLLQVKNEAPVFTREEIQEIKLNEFLILKKKKLNPNKLITLRFTKFGRNWSDMTKEKNHASQLQYEVIKKYLERTFLQYQQGEASTTSFKN